MTKYKEKQQIKHLSGSGVYGVDVSKDKLDISDGTAVIQIGNNKSAISQWFTTIPSGSEIAMEATGKYSLLLANLAVEAGHIAYVINPRRIKEYRVSHGKQQKNDAADARLIWRYLVKEGDDLKSYVPRTEDQEKVQAILTARATLSNALVQTRQSFNDIKEHIDQSLGLEETLESLKAQIAVLDKELHRIKKELKDPGFDRLYSMTGVGIVTAASTWVVFSRYPLETADAAVAMAGMDLKFDDSGKSTGRRRISKQGNVHLRRMYFCAAMAGTKSAVWKDVYKRYKDRGFKPIEALCIIARKMIRTAWAVYYLGKEFDAKRVNNTVN